RLRWRAGARGRRAARNAIDQPARNRDARFRGVGANAPRVEPAAVPRLSGGRRRPSARRPHVRRLRTFAARVSHPRLLGQPKENRKMKSRWAAWMFGMFLLVDCDRPGSTSGTSTTAVAPSAAPSVTSAASVAAPVASADVSGGGAIAVTFDAETPGAPSDSFEGVVGDWYVADRAGARGLKVDGSRWRNGEPSANLAEQAKRLYGERYAEFLDGVKAFAFC